jgi:putative oxidoreductase
MKFNFETLVRLVIAGVLLQTLFFKFTAAEESVYIFTTLGIEPVGRIGSGVAELIAAVLILLPTTIGIGATLALGLIAGALMSHFTVLGIEVKGDGGTLFYLALVVFIGSAWLAWKHRKEIPILKSFFK